MKKTFILTIMALLMAVGANAQVKKTWDFTKGLSDETVINLNADATNWGANGTDKEGVTNNWQNKVKPSTTEQLKANGEVIPETAGLLFDIGSNKDNSIHLAQDKIRLTRANTIITFPKLTNGQTITIVGRSANGTADASDKNARGIAPVQDYLKYVGDPSALSNGKCYFLGNQVENSLGTYTFQWQVETTSTDSVDVQFKLTPNAGIDFTLFMIDGGDEPVIVKTLYLYDGTQDVVYNYLEANENIELTAIDVTQSDITAEGLRDYDVTIIGTSVPTDKAIILKEALPWTPILNLNGNMYTAWGYGEIAEQGAFVKIKSTKNALFSDVEYVEADEGNVLVVSDNDPGLAVTLGDYFSGDEILGTTLDDAQTFIHTHNINHNGYIYIPGVANYTDAALQAIGNAINMLNNSKKEITGAATPSISQEFKDQKTLITLTPGLTQPKTQIYYTIDGTDPTTESGTPYAEPFFVNTTCTVKAIAIAEGYTASTIASAEVTIYSQPKTPTVTCTESEDGLYTTIKISYPYESKEDSARIKVYYNFEDKLSTDIVKSTLYADSIPVVITMPQYVNVFAVADSLVWSEVARVRALVKNPRVVIDVAAHFKADAWADITNGNGLFAGGKKATSMYDSTQPPIGTTEDENGDEVTIYPEVEYQTKDEPGEDPQWTIMSKGQAVLWQSNNISTDKIGENEGGYYPTVSEDIDPLFPATKNDIQFAEIFSGEHANAAIQSKNKYQAPLDIVVFANMQGGPIVAQVSADGEIWETVGEEIAKTGYSRMWKKYTRSYNGTGEVYVRVAQETGSATAKIFDIYIANQGEKSQELLKQLQDEYTGIEEVQQQTTKVAAGIYNLSGVRQNSLQRGLNIVVEADGTVKKVVVK